MIINGINLNKKLTTHDIDNILSYIIKTNMVLLDDFNPHTDGLTDEVIQINNNIILLMKCDEVIYISLKIYIEGLMEHFNIDTINGLRQYYHKYIEDSKKGNVKEIDDDAMYTIESISKFITIQRKLKFKHLMKQ